MDAPLGHIGVKEVLKLAAGFVIDRVPVGYDEHAGDVLVGRHLGYAAATARGKRRRELLSPGLVDPAARCWLYAKWLLPDHSLTVLPTSSSRWRVSP